MKLISSLIVSVTLIAISVIAAPANDLERRASVSGKIKYRGDLYVVKLDQLGDYSDPNNRGTPLRLDGDYLTHSDYSDFFFFQEGTASGWNQSPKQFGRLKYNSYDKTSFTAETFNSGSGRALRRQADATSTGNLLDRQWFYANYINGQYGPYITLQLTGNPNDKNTEYDLPYAAYFNDHDTATKKNTGYTYTLFNVTVLSWSSGPIFLKGAISAATT